MMAGVASLTSIVTGCAVSALAKTGRCYSTHSLRLQNSRRMGMVGWSR
jgi:hypothetical protein